jgi:hypothetical protein
MLSQLSNLISSCWNPETDDAQEEPVVEKGSGPKPTAMTMDKGNGKALSPEESSELFGHYADASASPGKQEIKPEEVIEKLITLYHVSSDKDWANEIANGKAAKKPLDKLKHPIDPDRGREQRKDNPFGDGRGGDDLGPGFYTGDSPQFVDYYTKDHSETGDSSVMQFQLPEKELAKLTRRDVKPDDEEGFKQSMRDGFSTKDTKTDKWSPPALDKGKPPTDLVTGPINDIAATKKMGLQTDGETQHFPGSILKLGEETPLQYTFATQEGVQSLYENANITNYSIKDWREMREKQNLKKEQK